MFFNSENSHQPQKVQKYRSYTFDENTEYPVKNISPNPGHSIDNFSEVSLQEFKSYSKSLLHDIVFGIGGVNEKKLLREMYYSTLEILAYSG